MMVTAKWFCLTYILKCKRVLGLACYVYRKDNLTGNDMEQRSPGVLEPRALRGHDSLQSLLL